MLKFFLTTISLVSLATLFLASCSGGLPTQLAAARTSYEVRKDVVYTPPTWPAPLEGDLYQPQAKEPTPGVLLIHGGGWTGGDKRSQMAAIARRLAKRGYLVFNVTYRTTPEWQHPAQFDDLLQALKWMKSNAKELNLDSARLATFGYSAGGHLAALVGLQSDSQGLPVQAIVAGGAPMDLTLTASPLVELLLGGSRGEKPERHREASPIHFVKTDSPPVFLYHASQDQVVLPKHAELMQGELREKGVPYQFEETAGPGHATGFLFQAKPSGRRFYSWIRSCSRVTREASSSRSLGRGVPAFNLVRLGTLGQVLVETNFGERLAGYLFPGSHQAFNLARRTATWVGFS